LPGATGTESVLRLHATVGADARFEYLPEPVVIADGARHRTELRVTLAADATLLTREEVILGRHGERGGECVARILVDLDGTPLLRQEVAVNGTDPTSLGPAVLAGHRAFGSLVIVGNGQRLPGMAGEGVAVMPLARQGTLVTAVAHDARDLRSSLERVVGSASSAEGGRPESPYI
jgi:urease accessory protein